MTENSVNIMNRPFSLPVETGLRCLYILAATTPYSCDLQRLVYYDYLLVYSGDVENGPASLHPSIPHRGGAWMVRRKVVEDGLNLMFSKELIQKQFVDRGIYYSATELTEPFLAYLVSNYAQSIRKSARWVVQTFQAYSEKELSDYMNQNIGQWGAEFNRESVVRGRKP